MEFSWWLSGVEITVPEGSLFLSLSLSHLSPCFSFADRSFFFFWRPSVTCSDLWISVFKRDAADTRPVPEEPGGSSSLFLSRHIGKSSRSLPSGVLCCGSCMQQLLRDTWPETRPKFLVWFKDCLSVPVSIHLSRLLGGVGLVFSNWCVSSFGEGCVSPWLWIA